MRLGQLARKISIRQLDIVDYLSKSGVSMANDSNARLEDEHVKSIIRHFAPSFFEENTPISESISLEVALEPVLVSVAEESNESPQEDSFDQAVPQGLTEVEEEKTEVIKAAKIDLPGLKVLGKIELPEPKKKEVAPLENVEEVPEPQTETNKPRAPRSQSTQKNRPGNKRERTHRSSINTIALQRERDARAAEEKRRLDAIKDKENRTEYYLNRLKSNAPTKAAKIFSEPVEELVVTEKEKPKTLLGRFFRWLTTA